jgi:hypothetical protein
VGEDPDGGTCDGVLSWHVGSGALARYLEAFPA